MTKRKIIANMMLPAELNHLPGINIGPGNPEIKIARKNQVMPVKNNPGKVEFSLVFVVCLYLAAYSCHHSCSFSFYEAF